MGKTTCIAAGDSIITRMLPETGYEGFEELQALIRGHDVRFTNLEATVHDNEGAPCYTSGGGWVMTPPALLDDLCRYGFNLFATANNHSMDFSQAGVLATIRHLKEQNLVFSGTGSNLSEASEACYLDCRDSRIALLSACSTLAESSAAGEQKRDMPGRPGLNPIRFRTVHVVEPKYIAYLKEIAGNTEINARQDRLVRTGFAQPPGQGLYFFGGSLFEEGSENRTRTFVHPADMERMETAIREAGRQADLVLVSVHSHENAGTKTTQPTEFMEEYCRRCIDAGASVVIGHGPHEVRGIELYHGGAIFYSLGNFLFETDTLRHQPAESYDRDRCPYTMPYCEKVELMESKMPRGYHVMPEIWRAVMAGWEYEDGRLKRIVLYPISLGMELPRSRKGRPRLDPDCGVLEQIAELSKPFKTEIRIENGRGYIDL